MWPHWIPFWRPAASSYGGDIDLLFAGLLAISVATMLLLFALLLRFCVHYRAGSTADRSHRIKKSWYWEISWTTATLIGFLALFVWGAILYLDVYSDPLHALPIYVVGKQWMWKVEHPGGQREINELHVPAGRPIWLIMASEDVIHSFFVPAFRVKHDVVPGRYQNLWFEADQPGVFDLLCAEFCGTDHSRMRGRVVVLEPAAYEAWLSRQEVSESLVSEGGTLFRQLGCSGCHVGQGTVRAPSLVGVYGKPVPLQDGRLVPADERYIRDSILQPRSEIAAGYAPLMPSFAGRVTEDQLIRLVAYIKSLADEAEPTR
jgi:cytochrome c oxidase subunit 2